jgi:hypothetical protein
MMQGNGTRKAIVVAGALVALALPAAAQTVISTSGGGTPISPFGDPTAQTFGQTFTTPTDNVLQSFTFYLGPAPSLLFKAYVFQWDALLGRATGAALFTSNAIQGPTFFGLNFTPIAIATGGLSLLPGATYAAFFSVFGTIGEVALQDAWDSPGFNQYSGGAFVYLNTGNNASAWTTQTWSTDRQGVGSDVRFDMVFTATPEPSSVALVATALLGLSGAAIVRRRRGFPLGH